MSDYFAAAESLLLGDATFAFFGRSNIWVEDTVVETSSTRVCQHIINTALCTTYPGQLEVTVFDDGLTGIGAPFDGLNNGGVKLFNTLNNRQEFKEVLLRLKDYVQGVNNLMKGRADNLVEFRRLVGFPVEGYKLIVISTDIALLDTETQNLLSVLLRAAPRTGVSFLIHSVISGVEFLANYCMKIRVPGLNLTIEGQSFGSVGALPSPEDLISTGVKVSKLLSTSAMPVIDFARIESTSDFWYADSANGLTFSIGLYGDTVVTITLGDELNQRHNMLITGAVGQGKTNLLSVILHSLCQRYSPQQLELYLLDLKEGVTLQAFTSEESGEYLPHAKVLGLEADREFALRVLEFLFSTYKQRMAIFKETGVQNLKEYRLKYPDKLIPRILLAIDEYQLLFADNDRLATEIAELLIRSVRLFRAAGIHVVLASQTIGGNVALMGSGGEGLFSQIPIRLALKNSISESYATLGSNNPGAAHLRPREVIVNEDYGAISSNKKVGVAWANETILSKLRHQWWQARETNAQPPYVFRGDRQLALLQHKQFMQHNRIRREPYCLLGAPLDVASVPVYALLTPDIGRNVAMIGVGEALSELCAVVASATASLCSASGESEVWVIDAVHTDVEIPEVLADFYSLLRQRGVDVRRFNKDEAPTAFAEAARRADTSGTNHLIIMGIGMERLRDLGMDFQDLCKYGPTRGVHVVAWWRKYDALRQQVGFGGESNFDVRIAFRVDPQTAKTLFEDPLIDWRGSDNRAMVWDSSFMPQAQSIIPYSSISSSANERG